MWVNFCWVVSLSRHPQCTVRSHVCLHFLRWRPLTVILRQPPSLLPVFSRRRPDKIYWACYFFLSRPFVAFFPNLLSVCSPVLFLDATLYVVFTRFLFRFFLLPSFCPHIFALSKSQHFSIFPLFPRRPFFFTLWLLLSQPGFEFPSRRLLLLHHPFSDILPSFSATLPLSRFKTLSTCFSV